VTLPREAPATRGATDPQGAVSRSPSELAGRVGQLAAEWSPTVARVLLGLVLAWFGYHELVQPSLWTGYVPLLSGSTLLVLLVLAHGWLLLVLATALVAGIAVRAVAGVAVLLLLQIVVTLTWTNGLSDLVLRDVGVLGLAVSLTAATRQRLVLKG
jgi:uncharacterized membrane protein YphA (DoxX/SURF4 family)